MRRLVEQDLDRLNPHFCRLYPEGGRPSIPPEQLLVALLLQAIYGIRSERLLIEQLDYNLLFRWFIGLNPVDLVWHSTTFTKNRDRVLNEELMAKFLELVLPAPEVQPLLSSEHFSVDGTLLRAWASHSSLERIDGLDDEPPPPNGGQGFGRNAPDKKRAKGDFRCLLLSNQTQRSCSDGEARLFKNPPGVGAYLSSSNPRAAPRIGPWAPLGRPCHIPATGRWGWGPLPGLIQSLSQSLLPELSAWVEVGGIASSLCSRAFLLQPISI